MDFSLFRIEPVQALQKQTEELLLDCNPVTAAYGLSLTADDCRALLAHRQESLAENGRIEFGGKAMQRLVLEFCDSPYISRAYYLETLEALLDLFYYFKNESMEELDDAELLHWMKRYFDGECQGSLDYLAGTSLEELCRKAREESF